MKKTSTRVGAIVAIAICLAFSRMPVASAAAGTTLGINSAELSYCRSPSVAPKCATAFPYRDVAITATRNYHGSALASTDGSVANSFQHAIWMVWTAWSVKDQGFAFAIGYYHEYPYPSAGTGNTHMRMDLHNDGWGINGATPATMALSFNNMVGTIQPFYEAIANNGEYQANGNWTDTGRMWFWKK